MIVLLIVGGALIAVAVVLALVARWAYRRVSALTSTRRSSCAQLPPIAAASQGAMVRLSGEGPDALERAAAVAAE